MANPSAIVIGAGIGGIAAAIRLAVKGYTVTVIEKNNYPGGKLAEIHLGPYRFDAGPSLFTLPDKVDELFRLAGEEPRDHFNYTRLDTVCNYFFDDGTRLAAYRDLQKFADEVEQVLQEPASAVLDYLQRSRKLYELTAPVFIDRPFGNWSAFFSAPFLKAMLHLRRMDVLRSLHRANASAFRNQKLVQLFDRYATYNGSNPYRAPAMLKVIPTLEFFYGAYLPEGGMYALPEALEALAIRLGVTFRYNTAAEEIRHDGKKVNGVRIKDGALNADIVVCNGDVFYMYEQLLKGLPAPQRILRQERSSSALVFNWGIRGSFPQLGLHNIFFSADYRIEFDDLFTRNQLPADPTLYLFISSKHLPGDAPPGCENWFLLLNAPPHSGQDWQALATAIRPVVISKINRLLNTDIASRIEQEEILDPRQIEARTASYRGSLYGTSSNSRWAAFNRHPNKSRRLRGLYFTGGSVHPGGGIPLCLSSAKLVASMVPAV